MSRVCGLKGISKGAFCWGKLAGTFPTAYWLDGHTRWAWVRNAQMYKPASLATLPTLPLPGPGLHLAPL